MKKEPRDYQSAVHSTVTKKLQKNVDSQIVVLPTGAGKTFTACGLIEILGADRTLWLTHREELIDQSGAALAMTMYEDPKALEDYLTNAGGLISALNRTDSVFLSDPIEKFLKANIGVIKQKRMDKDKRIVVASIQSLHRRLDQLDPNDFDLIVIDECHMAMAKTWKKCADYFTPKLLLGLTATPMRMDGVSLYGLFDEIVYQYELNQAILDGWLVEIDAIRCKTTIDIDEVHTRAGEFMTGELSNVVDCPERNNYIVDKYLEYAKGKQAIFYCVDIKHAKNLADTFYRRGLKSVNIIVSDEVITPNRKEIIRKFKNGDIDILTNVDILTTGFDYPALSVIGTACPTKSTVKYIQTVGRGTRPIAECIRGIHESEGRRKAIQESEKSSLILLDFVDVTSKHRLVNSRELDKGKDPKDRAFITQINREKLEEARRLSDEEKQRRIAKIDGIVEQDIRVQLIPLPAVVMSSSPKMREDATEKQLTYMTALGLLNEGSAYTKADAFHLISTQLASPKQVAILRKNNFEAGGDTTLGEYQAAMKIITEKREQQDAPVVKQAPINYGDMPMVFKVEPNNN